MCEFPIHRHVQLQHLTDCVTGTLTKYYHAGLGVDTLSANICTADVCCVQVDESSRQREEINSLLAQVRQCHNANIFPINKQIFSPLFRCATFRSGCRPTATRTMTSLPTSGCIRYLLFMFTGFSWSCKVYG